MAAGTSSSRMDFLDGTRGLAALYVLLHHIWLTAYPAQQGAGACHLCLDAPPWLDGLRYGQLAVVVFIVLSGFSLSLSPLRHGHQLPDGFTQYMIRRAFRIVPPYWAALLLSCLVIAAITGEHAGSAFDAKAIVVHALLLNNVIDSAKPNGAFWSIAVEWQIYFVFPVLLLLCRRFGTPVMVCLTTLTCITAYLLGTHYPMLAHLLGLEARSLALLVKLLHLSPQFLALFAFGVVAAHITTAQPWATSMPWGRVGMALGMATAGLLYLLPTGDIETHYFWIDLLAGASAACLFANFAQSPGTWVPRLLAGAVPKWLGQSSYSLYLIHVPVLEVVNVLLFRQGLLTDGNSSFIYLLALTVPLALLLAHLFWLAIEKPFTRHRSLLDLRSALLGRGATA